MTKKTENLPEKIPQFAIMAMEKDGIKDILAQNLGGERLEIKDLVVIKVPSGGATTWVYDSINGEIESKHIDGIIISTQMTRAYWPDIYSGGKEPPVCSSQNGLDGVGDPGGDCNTCPHNQFNTADGGKNPGKACSEKRFLFMVTPGEILPICVRAPAMSLSPSKTYLIGLTSAQKKMHSVVTRLTLVKDMNKKGQAYAKINFTKIADVEDPERSEAYAEAIKPHLASVATAANIDREN